MANKTKNNSKDSEPKQRVKVQDYIEQYKRAWDYHDPVRSTWDEKEKIVFSRLGDSISEGTKSQVNDPRLLSIMMERSFRVMNQLASGKVQALSRKDKGKSQFMDLILHKYVEPNATQQYDILTKFRLVDFYSFVYGSFGVLVDYVIEDDYVGPDFWMIPMRDLVPQPGRISVKDCDYVYVKTKVTRSWLKDKRGKEKWQNVDKLLSRTKGASHTLDDDYEEQSWAEREFGGEFREEKGEYREIELVTRYEKDRWITFSKETGLLLRDIENPHGNNKIPIVVKDSFPLVDRFYGLGEVEKGKTLQYAINSLINLYLDGVKFSIFPPIKVDLKNVVPSTIKREPGAKWVMKNMRMDAVAEHPISPQGINTFQSTYSFLIAALMNQAGTTDTTVGENIDPGLGKTPRALAMLNERQNARDAFDRFMMEKFIEEVYDMFLDLIAQKQEKPIKLTLFAEELQQIEKANPDVIDWFESEESGEVVIDPEDIKDVGYKFHIDAGSTYKRDEMLENESLKELLTIILGMPGAPEQIIQSGHVFLGDSAVDFSELIKRYIITRGVQDWDKIIRERAEVEAAMGADEEEDGVQFDNQDLQNLYNELVGGQGGQPQGAPPGAPPMQGQPPQGGQQLGI